MYVHTVIVYSYFPLVCNESNLLSWLVKHPEISKPGDSMTELACITHNTNINKVFGNCAALVIKKLKVFKNKLNSSCVHATCLDLIWFYFLEDNNSL